MACEGFCRIVGRLRPLVDDKEYGRLPKKTSAEDNIIGEEYIPVHVQVFLPAAAEWYINSNP